MLFTELNLPTALAQGVRDAGYQTMTPVQAACLSTVLAGGDVIAEAHTGSGKTAAFALGLLAALETSISTVQGLVLCPTRELADQVSREIRRLARAIPNVKVLTLCGGVPLRPQLASLTHLPHIVVGTPGRIQELIEKQVLPLDGVKVLVLDEADRMLDMGFADALDWVVKSVPGARQTLLFSATIGDDIRAVSRRLQREPLDVRIEDDAARPEIEQRFFKVEAEHKPAALRALLLELRPESAVVFCNTRHEVRSVERHLVEHGFAALALHGELEQREREEMLVRFANRSCTVLVASDVAARGLDIAELALVVNYELAADADTHLHRIGRTGRAGRRGLALNLCASREQGRLRAIAEAGDEPLHWAELPRASGQALPAPFVTLVVDAGRQDKLRPGDVLGALTGGAGLSADEVGKIDVFATRSYVAIARDAVDSARRGLRAGKIKGRNFRVRELAL
ncbi:MAG: ATP-dependent RNA helicase DbpA [Proteobacteria bacterium]|nr:ATP-dependent RNA helicase DbpA [Pseudomonadota bacterium]